MAGSTKVAMNLSNSIIGVSILAMPYCMKMCGVFLGFLMLIFSALLTRFTCHLLLKSAIVARRKSFEFLAFHTFGPVGKFVAELNIIGFMLGILISFFVVIGDLGPAIVSKALKIQNSQSLRTVVLVCLGFGTALPLAMLKELDSLARISTLSIVFYIILAMKTIIESLPILLSGDWINEIVLWELSGFLQSLPIFSLALSCQTQIFEIYDSMPDPSLKQMNSLVKIVMYLCTVLYFLVGVFGYIANYNKTFTGNILLSFSPGVTTELIKLIFVFAVAMSFPLVIFPCRTSIHSLLYRRINMPFDVGGPGIPQSRFKIITFFIVCSTLVIGILCPNIEMVLGFTGSTIGISTCVVFPALMFIQLVSKNTFERWGAQFALIIGIVLMVSCTWVNVAPIRSVPDSEYIKSEMVPLLQETVKMSDEDKIKINTIIMPTSKESSVLISEDAKHGHIPKKKDSVGCPKGSSKLCNITEPVNDDNPKRQEPPIPQEPEEINDEKEHLEHQVALKDVQEPKKLKAEENDGNAKNDLESDKKSNHPNILEDSGKKALYQQEEILRKLEEQQKQQKILLEEQREILKELKAHERSHDKNEPQYKEKRTEHVEEAALESHNKQSFPKDKSKAVSLGKADELTNIRPVVKSSKHSREFENGVLNMKAANVELQRHSNGNVKANPQDSGGVDHEDSGKANLPDIIHASNEITVNVGAIKDDTQHLQISVFHPVRVIANNETKNAAPEPEVLDKLSADQVKGISGKVSNSLVNVIVKNVALKDGSTSFEINTLLQQHSATEFLDAQHKNRLHNPADFPKHNIDEKFSESKMDNGITLLPPKIKHTQMESDSKQFHKTVHSDDTHGAELKMPQDTFEEKKVGRDLKNDVVHEIGVNM